MSGDSPDIIGNSPALRAAMELAKRVAKYLNSVLILGETGTGKELFARYIHNHSPRANKIFRATNSAAFSENIIESELFGHSRGAFTGAHSDKIGLFEEADGGTLLLDEIADIPFHHQSKLLRVLQEGVFRPVGGKKDIRVDVRILAATNKNLELCVQKGEFREGLLYRIEELIVKLPPLREREQDVLIIADHFIKKHPIIKGKILTQEAKEILKKYSWYGNVWELHSVIRKAAIQSDRQIEAAHIQEHLKEEVKIIPDCRLHPIPELIISHLEQVGSASQAEIHKHLNVARSTVCDIIHKLERNGYIQKINPSSNRRYALKSMLKNNDIYLNERQRMVMVNTKNIGWVTRKKYAETVKCSISTERLELIDLMKKGFLVSGGLLRQEARYILPKQV